MMGPSHALSGAAVWLAGSWALDHFAGHAGFVAVIAAVLVGLWALSHAHFFWPAIPLIFLVMGLMRHARYGRYRAGYSYRHHVAPWNAPTYR